LKTILEDRAFWEKVKYARYEVTCMSVKRSSLRQVWSAAVITLLALTIVYVVGATFFNVELERLVEHTITPHILASRGVEVMNREIYSDLEGFMAEKRIRLVGYAFLVTMILLTLLGLIVEKKGLAFLGSVSFILPIYAYFVIHMSFLAGLGILAGLWQPFWGDLLRLADIAYLPYMILVYPFSLLGLDIRLGLAYLLTDLGLLIFLLGILAWFYARWQKKGTADFWIYRFTRHPQYLGWIVWSYGLMLRASLSRGIPLHNTNPGASLPWLVSSLIIVCIALSEEVHMSREYGEEYQNYWTRAPFLLPLPGFVSKWINAPLRLILRKGWPDRRWDLVWTFVIYLTVIVLLSLPFLILDWPPGGGWMDWPALGS
jgi:protein-S-isoprenylcysteine O-methyltransferase Ste14